MDDERPNSDTRRLGRPTRTELMMSSGGFGSVPPTSVIDRERAGSTLPPLLDKAIVNADYRLIAEIGITSLAGEGNTSDPHTADAYYDLWVRAAKALSEK